MKSNVLVMLVSILAGCATGRSATPPNIYDFGPPGWPIKEAVEATHGARIALDVWAAPWLDSTYIDYRLAYDDPLKRRQYADSRWASSPRTLVAQQLQRQLGLVSINGGVSVDCLMRVELHEYSHVFGSVQESRGVLLGQASLIDGKRRVIAVRPFNVEVAATTPDARGGVRALVQSSMEMGQQLGVWLNQLEKSGRIGACSLGKG